MIYHAYLEDDGPDGQSLVLEGDDGSHMFQIGAEGLESLDMAMEPWRRHMDEGERVRAEYEASGRMSWAAYKDAQERTQPEWADEALEAGDLLRKIEREGGPR